MNILIIEDDEFKQRWIAEAVADCLPEAIVAEARSVNAGLTALQSTPPDALLLDMSLTTFDVGPDEPGGRPQNFGGLEVLRQMDRLGLVVPTVVITQHERFESATGEIDIDKLADELNEDFPDSFRGIIYYNSSQGAWKLHLKRILRELTRRSKA